VGDGSGDRSNLGGFLLRAGHVVVGNERLDRRLAVELGVLLVLLRPFSFSIVLGIGELFDDWTNAEVTAFITDAATLELPAAVRVSLAV
jgi:hypothetical protein